MEACNFITDKEEKHTYFTKHPVWLLLKSERKHKTIFKSKTSWLPVCFSGFVPYTFSIRIYLLDQNIYIFFYFLFNESSRKSEQFPTKWINYKRTGLLLKKGKYFLYYNLDFYIKHSDSSDIICCFSICIFIISRSHKIATTSSMWPQIFLGKKTKCTYFFNY